MVLGACLLLSILAVAAYPQGLFSPGPDATGMLQPAAAHRGRITNLAYDRENRLVVSTGMDGFIGLWNIERKEASERFQVSPYGLTFLALRPGKSQAAVVESDGFGLFRVSAWDLSSKQKLFTLRFRDTVTSLSYSATGSFLIVGRSARNGVVIIDPEDGTIRQVLDTLGPVSFAVTGRSERIILLYSPRGRLSYWDLETSAEVRSLAVLPNLTSVHLTTNNRFLVGIGDRGLVVVDALNGTLLGRGEAATSALLVGSQGGEFALIERTPSGQLMGRLHISAEGLPRRVGAVPILLPGDLRAAVALEAGYAIAGADGVVHLADGIGNIEKLRVLYPVPIRDAAAGSLTLALLGDDFLLRLPADPDRIRDGTPLTLLPLAGYNQLTAGRAEDQSFLLWSSTNHLPPLYWKEDGSFSSLPAAAATTYRSISHFHGRFLALDAGGRVTVLRPESEFPDFTFSSLALLDGTFIDSRRILLGRSVSRSITPFLIVDIITGETLAGAYPAKAAVRVYRDAGGTLYAAVVLQEAELTRTKILRVNTSDFSSSVPMVEYQGEDVSVQLAVSGDAYSGTVLATTLGGDGAGVFSLGGFTPFERTEALPRRIFTAGDGFAAVDADGALVWYETSGKVSAVFRLSQTTWELVRADGTRAGGSLSRVTPTGR